MTFLFGLLVRQMNVLSIPKTFSLLGLEYSVQILSVGDWKDADPGVLTVGTYDPQTCSILIKEQSYQQMVHTFFHELSHVIMLAMGKDELYAAEGFVDLLGSMIQQILQSAEYNDGEDDDDEECCGECGCP